MASNFKELSLEEKFKICQIKTYKQVSRYDTEEERKEAKRIGNMKSYYRKKLKEYTKPSVRFINISDIQIPDDISIIPIKTNIPQQIPQRTPQQTPQQTLVNSLTNTLTDNQEIIQKINKILEEYIIYKK